MKTITGIKRFQEDRGYGKWFNALFEVLKRRDSCQPVMTLITAEKMLLMVDFCSQRNVMKVQSSKHKLDSLTSQVMKVVEDVVNNDPTKDLINFMREEMEKLRNYFSSCSTTVLEGAMVIALMVCLHPPAWHMAQQGLTLHGRVEVGKATRVKHFCQSLALEALFHLIQGNTSLYRVPWRLYC